VAHRNAKSRGIGVTILGIGIDHGTATEVVGFPASGNDANPGYAFGGSLLNSGGEVVLAGVIGNVVEWCDDEASGTHEEQ
jgi:hypothetical protein